MEREIQHTIRIQQNRVKNAPASLKERTDNLKKLRNAILDFEDDIYDALYRDLHKSRFEAYATEIGFVLEEIKYHLKHLRKWMKPKRVSTPITNFPAAGFLTYEPKGVVLIISPWNYPFQLLIAPLIGAFSAGNSVILKPSEISVQTAGLLEKLINTTFPSETARVFTGGAEVAQLLLKQQFDHIFFTGSPRIGKIVMREAANNMTPVTLELGGKSPCIVDKDINLKVTARRIVWGKLLNAGQTCIAPDYLAVHRSIKEEFLKALKEAVIEAYGNDPYDNDDYPRIISEANMERLAALLEGPEIYYGGKYDKKEKYFQPTILDKVTFEMPVMQQEIFGPLFPVIAFDDYQQIVEKITERPKPLALYIFTKNRSLQKMLLQKISAGGACINDTVMHIASPKLPFGGIGNSGIGKYHGKYSFETFSNAKPVVKKAFWPDVPVRYAPFGNKLKIIKLLMK